MAATTKDWGQRLNTALDQIDEDFGVAAQQARLQELLASSEARRREHEHEAKLLVFQLGELRHRSESQDRGLEELVRCVERHLRLTLSLHQLEA